MADEGNRQLRGGMYPLYHCACKRAVVETEDGKCQYCEKGIERTPYSIPESPPVVNWKTLRDKIRMLKGAGSPTAAPGRWDPPPADDWQQVRDAVQQGREL